MATTVRFLGACLMAALSAAALAQTGPGPAALRGAGGAALATHPRVAAALDTAATWLEAQRAYEEIPGVSAAIVYDQDVLWIGAYGLADIARRAPARPDTIYSICSISKLFTSIAVMQQRDAGRLRLDDPVRRHLPWFDLRVTAPEAGDITIEGLLTHASGLPRESDHPYWTGPSFEFPTREAIVAGLKNQETVYPAETYFQYSNLGLTLAGEVAAAAAGQPYAAYVKARILDPLGLASTFPEMPEAERGRRLATGYSAIQRDGTRSPMPFFQARGIAPAAGFASTAEDLARFASWQFRVLGGHGGTGVLAAPTLREMHRVHWVDPDFETTWGLGFSVWRSDGRTFVGHGGSCPGFRTQLLLKPDEKIATVFMANALGVNAQQYAQRLYDLVAPAVRAATRPDQPEAAPKPPDPTLAAYVGTYRSSFGGEIAVVRWEDGLAMLGLPTTDPVRALTKLRPAGEHTFRRVRRDEALGEAVVFEMGPDGRAARIRWWSNYYPRVPETPR
jgi:CubicO group peptidase (beta-lactamase class C family)